MNIREWLHSLFRRTQEPWGMKVTIKFVPKAGGQFDIDPQVYRNVTEVHWNFKRPWASTEAGRVSNRVAIESDIHGTGTTWDTDWVDEIEILPETEIATAF